MASTWSSGGLNLRLMTTGENDNTWGDQTNDNLKRLENKITGYAAVTLSGTTHTLTFTDNPTSYADEDGRNFVLNFGGSPGGTCTVTIPARETVYLVLNNTADSNTITLTTGSGTTFNVPAGKDAFVYSDGTNVYNAMADAIFSTITGDGSALTGVLHDVVDDTTPQLGGNLDLNSNDITGTGNIDITGSIDAGQLNIENTSTGTGGAIIDLYHNTTSPADNDNVGFVRFYGKDTGGNKQLYGKIIAIAEDVTGNTEDSKIQFNTFRGGVEINSFSTSYSEAVFNEDSYDIDFRVESDGLTHAFHLDGTDGRIGIGTAAISGARLEVNETSNGVFAGRFTNSHATGSYGLEVKGGNSSSNYTANFSTKDGTSLMRIRGDGNVGIGTTSPSSKLDINGDLKFGTSASRNNLGDYGTTDLYLINQNSSGTTQFYVGGGTGDKERMRITTAETVINEQSNDYDFRVESNNFANMLFVNAGTDRVGIGTNSPTTTLDVSKDSTSNIRVGGTGGSAIDTRLYVDNVGNGGSGRGVGIALRPSGSSNSVEAVKLIGYQQTAASTANNAKFAIQVANSSGTLTERVSINNTGVFNITGSLTVNGSAVGGGDFGGADKYVTYNGSSQSTYKALGLSSMTRISALYYRLNFNSTLSGNTYLTTFAHSNSTSANTRGAAIGFIDSRTTTTVQVRAEERVGGFTGELDYISVGVWDV